MYDIVSSRLICPSLIYMKGRFFSLIFVLVLAFVVVPATTVHASNPHEGYGHGRGNNCQNDPKNPHCQISVPEFGFIPGLIATFSSAGAFYALKRRSK
jgi:hypothetical protein